MVWQKKLLGEVSQIYSGFAFRSQDLGVKGIPVLKIANIQNKLVVPKCADHFPEELLTDRLNRYFLHSDDTLVAMTGAGSVGKVGKMPAVEGKYLVNQRVGIVRPDRSMCDPSFIYYCLSQDFYETKLYALGLGAGQPNVSGKQIAELEILSPPIPVQQRIAGILSAYDELIENNQRRIKILEAMARGLYREWFVHFRFPGHESHPRVASALGEIPQGWEVKKLGDISSYINRGITPTYDDEGNSVVINQKCVRDHRLNLEPARKQSKAVSNEKRVCFGDVLVNSTGVGTLGRVAQVYENLENYTVDTHVTITRAKRDIDLDFYGCCLLSLQETFERMGVGATGQTELGRAAISDIDLAIPPIILQQQFGKSVHGIRSAAETYAKKIQNLRRTRDLLLPRLLSGQISVDPKEAIT
jgi:type I restriction enzyme S subunit